MSDEIKNSAVELSIDELETVAGGFGIILAPAQALDLDTDANFQQKDLAVAQQTFAGPGGAGNALVVQAREIKSNSGQSLNLFN
ncbi:CTB family bacteriocin [Calothrix sp. NIES-3974]|uniref:CTB family bacteriocin n=1 Tax=Calothrix sp. NIES-3974 TaxID=2005462 RepID=UPI000B611AF6|nr:CTB family bacteriocin [Calothrix sp. NIES-3974]BAZ03664.1 hypothetical protein NIES3974_02930 [Calothrix sp. NIES-3974]